MANNNTNEKPQKIPKIQVKNWKKKATYRKMGEAELESIFDDPVFLAQHRKAVWVFEGAINWIMSKLGSMMIVVDKEGLKDPNPYIGVRAIIAPELLKVQILEKSKPEKAEEESIEMESASS